MILQRDLANPQHLLGHSSSTQLHPLQQRQQQQHQYSGTLANVSRSRSYVSITSPHDQLPPQAGGAEPVPPEALKPEMRKRHSFHNSQYGSQSHLFPEYHDNPYLASLSSAAPPPSSSHSSSSSTSPVKQPQAIPYGTLPRRRGGATAEGAGPEMGVLSQPVDMYGLEGVADPAYAHTHMHGHVLSGPGGDRVGGEYTHAHHYPGAGQLSYGSSAVYSASSRKKRKKGQSAAGRGNEQGLPPSGAHTGAMSQPDFAPPGAVMMTQPPPSDSLLYGRGKGGGSMRHAPHLGRAPEVDGGQGSFARAATVTARSGNYKPPSHHYLHGDQPHPPNSLENGMIPSGVGSGGSKEEGQAAEEEELPVEWEVRSCDMSHVCHMFVTCTCRACQFWNRSDRRPSRTW